MKHLIYFFFSILALSCSSNKEFSDKLGYNSQKIEVNYSIDGNSGTMFGIYSNSETYVLFNLFGPLGRNILKLYIESDTICLIDLVNSKRINLFSKNALSRSKYFFKVNNEFLDSTFICDILSLLKIDFFDSNSVVSANLISNQQITCLDFIFLNKIHRNKKDVILVKFNKVVKGNFIEFIFINKKLDKVESFNKMKYYNFESIIFGNDD